MKEESKNNNHPSYLLLLFSFPWTLTPFVLENNKQESNKFDQQSQTNQPLSQDNDSQKGGRG